MGHRSVFFSILVIVLVCNFSCKSKKILQAISKESNLEKGIGLLANSDYYEMIWQNPHMPPIEARLKTHPPLSTTGIRSEQGGSFSVSNFDPVSNTSNSYVIQYNHEFHTIPNKDNTGSDFFKYSFEIKNETAVPKQYAYIVFYENTSYKYDENNLFTFFKAGENFYGSHERSHPAYRLTPTIDPGAKKLIKGRYHIEGDSRSEHPYQWRRPPRMGTYQLLLLVVEKQHLKNVPPYLLDVRKPYTEDEGRYWNNNLYINPMILNQTQWNIPGSIVILSNKKLRLKIDVDLSKPLQNTTGNAPFSSPLSESFFHASDPDSYTVDAIPEVADYDNYTNKDYDRHKQHYHKKTETKRKLWLDYNDGNQGLSIPVVYKGKPAVKFYNPGIKKEDLHKRKVARYHTGVRMIGMQYGKMRAKILYPEMLNKHQVWNGIHNTLWYSQSTASEWNRQSCSSDNPYHRTEFDIEFMDFTPRPEDRISKHLADRDFTQNHNLIRAVFSNFDYRCTPDVLPGSKDFKRFPPFKYIQEEGPGAITYTEKGRTYSFDVNRHISDNGTSFLYIEKLVNDDALFGKPFYYEIEWTPTELIWRWGSDPNNLEVVAYMNSTFTSIPSNVMSLIVAQHALYRGNYNLYSHRSLPFPLQDIEGYILEIRLE